MNKFISVTKLLTRRTPEASENQLSGRPFSVAQIEITTRCNTDCTFCARTCTGEDWISGDLPFAVYQEHILPHLQQFELVHLQGWGEPMLHPHLWEMLEGARKMGCRTSFTTNASQLDENQTNRLVDSDVNLISISFAGADQLVHQSQRLSSSWDVLVSNVARLTDRKVQRGVENPWIELHYLMTKVNFHQLPAFVDLAARLGADEVVATNLTYAPTRDIDEKRVFGERIPSSHGEILAQAQANACKYELPLRVYPLELEPLTTMCDSKPTETIFINHLGEVTPCVYLGLSLRGDIPRFFQGESHPTSRVSFGNVRDGLLESLASPARKEFIGYFQRRRAAKSPLAYFAFDYNSPDQLPLPPPECQFCYKMYAV